MDTEHETNSAQKYLAESDLLNLGIPQQIVNNMLQVGLVPPPTCVTLHLPSLLQLPFAFH